LGGSGVDFLWCATDIRSSTDWASGQEVGFKDNALV
ncbi:unnamed protein product, partial [Allacma fusca]